MLGFQLWGSKPFTSEKACMDGVGLWTHSPGSTDYIIMLQQGNKPLPFCLFEPQCLSQCVSRGSHNSSASLPWGETLRRFLRRYFRYALLEPDFTWFYRSRQQQELQSLRQSLVCSENRPGIAKSSRYDPLWTSDRRFRNKSSLQKWLHTRMKA